MAVVPIENAGEHFIGIVFTFDSNGELMQYSVIVSHVAEEKWLRDVAKQISLLIGVNLAREP